MQFSDTNNHQNSVRFLKLGSYITSILLMWMPVFSHANSIPVTDEALWTLVKSTYQSVESTTEANTPFYQTVRLLSQPCEMDIALTDQTDDLLQEAEYWENNYGIELRGGLTTGDLESSQIDEQGTTYVELSWDVLDNGYKEFEYRAKDLKRRAALELLGSQLTQVATLYRCRDFQVGQSFIAVEASLANQKLALMEAVYQIEKQAYFDGGSGLDELLISEEAIVTLRRRLEALNARWNLTKTSMDVLNPPAFMINIETLLDAVIADPRFKDVSTLEQQRASNINPYQDGNRLRFFLRKEFDILSSNRDDLIAGVRFSVPIVFADRPNYQNKIIQLQNEQSLEQWERVNRVRQAYESFQQQSNRYVTQQYRYLRSKERMRRVFSREMLGDPLILSAVVARLTTYVDASMELLAVKRSLFERANNVFLASRLTLSTDYIAPFETNVRDYRSRPFNRGVYVWSSAFNRVPNEQILQIAETQSFERLFLSYSKNTDKDKLHDFIEQAHSNSVEVAFMLSDNQWFKPQNHAKAADSVARLSMLTQHVHLDIEPHTVDGYKASPLAYQQDYIGMLETIRKHSPDIKISVAVPFHWDLATYEQITPLVDELVVMNYENDDADRLTKRMKTILSVVPLSKVTMAIRPKDFASGYMLEETLSVVSQATGIDRFVMHKLSDLITP